MAKTTRKNKKIYQLSDFGLDNSYFCEVALSIVEKLQSAGFEAYLVGGCIRDLLSGITPKDFDVVTSASPEQITPIFPKSRIIGKRFQIVHVYYRGQRYREFIEVATFRAPENKDTVKTHSTNQHGMLTRDNIYGGIEEDVSRRDFTINALYYNPQTEEIIDFYDGVQAIKDYQLNIIGEAEQRFIEDPVRMLRAVRFQVKCDAIPSQGVIEAIHKKHQLLQEVNHSRMFDEVVKLLLNGQGQAVFNLLSSYRILGDVLPSLVAIDREPRRFIQQGLAHSDKRLQSGKYVVPYFLYAVLLWPRFIENYAHSSHSNKFYDASAKVFHEQNKHTQITKKVAQSIRDVWYLQFQMSRVSPKIIHKVSSHEKFRAAYDFTLLREETLLLPWESRVLGFAVSEYGAGEWWTKFQYLNHENQEKMIAEAHKSPHKLNEKKTNKKYRKHSKSRVKHQNKNAQEPR